MSRQHRAPGPATARIRFDWWPEFARFMEQKAGERGIFVRMANPPAIGTELSVQLVLPDGSDLLLPARVVHRLGPEEAEALGENPGAGVQLTHMSEELADRLQEIMLKTEAALARSGRRVQVSMPRAPAPGKTIDRTPSVPVNREPASRSAQPTAERASPAPPARAPAPAPVPAAPAPHDARIDQAASLLERARFDAAERKLIEVLEQHPGHPAARILLLVVQARKLRSQFELEEAIARYHTVLELDPSHAEAREQLTVLHGELQRSRAMFEEVFGKRER